MLQLEIGGVEFNLNPAAISAIRYRTQYADSVVNHLSECEHASEVEGVLLRMCHMMIADAQRPPLADFARLAHADKLFLEKALQARAALLSEDQLSIIKSDREPDGTKFDEYSVLALMVAANADMQLVFELPILHLISVLNRYFDMQDPDKKSYQPLSDKEMATLYPR